MASFVIRRLFALTLTTVALCSCANKASEGASYELSSSQCQLQSEVAIVRAGASTSAGLVGCRFHFDQDSRVATWQLTTAGSQGSWLSPGTGWITLSVNVDSPENATLALARTVSTLPAHVDTSELVFVYNPTDRVRTGGTGSVEVGQNVVSTVGNGGALTIDLSGVTTSTEDGTSIRLSGTATMQASPATASSSAAGAGGGGGNTGGSGGGCADNGASCKSTGACGSGGQRACYCAAAQTYACFLSHGCYKEAGAMTSVTQAQLVSGCESSNSSAAALGGGTCVSCQ